MSYVVLLDGVPVAVFSGGSLLVGSAGRSDLLGEQRAPQLARLQYLSVMRLAELPEDTGLYPTHGEGSFCTSVAARTSSSTIGLERRTNVVLQYSDADAFVAGQLAGLQPFPSYYTHMGPINLMGPEPLASPVLPELEPSALPEGGFLVDVRPRASFAAGHVPGSIGLEMSDRVGVWAGWLLPFDAEVVIVAERGQDAHEVRIQFGRIGFDHVAGVLYDLDSWAESNGALASFETKTFQQLHAALTSQAPPQVLDVRAPGDWELGSLAGSILRYTPHLVDGLPAELDRDRDVWVVCASGFRAMAASTYLEQGGFRPVVVTEGGVSDVLQLTSISAPAQGIDPKTQRSG
jgi:hydroxyacylglutathione hydrolase